MSDDNTAKPVSRGRHIRRVGLWSMLGIVVLLAALVFYGLSLLGTQVRAPDWVKDKIIAQVNRDTEDVKVNFGGVSIVMNRDWTPRLMLRDVVVTGGDNQTLVTLSDIQGTVALSPLLKGELQPTAIYLSGAQVLLRRTADGRVDLSIGENGSTFESAPGVAALIDNFDRFLMQPQLAGLKRVEADNLTLQFEDARVDRAWTVDGGRMALTRTAGDVNIRGDFALLGGHSYAATLEMNYDGRLGDTAAEFGFSFQDMPAADLSGQSPALTWLAALDAPMSGSLRGAIDAEGKFGPLSATLQMAEGALRPTETTPPIKFSAMRTYFTYDPVDNSMQIDEFAIDSEWGTASADGRAYLVGVENGFPREILGQVQVSELTANPEDIYSEPISIDGASLDMRLQINPFVITVGEMRFSDNDSRFVLSGEVSAEENGWKVAVDGRLDQLQADRLKQLWPEGVKPGSRKWVFENVEQGQLSNVQVALRLLPNIKPDIFMAFDFADLTTRFMRDVPLIKKGAGHAELMDGRFVVTAEGGHVKAKQGGRIDITGTSFIVPNVKIKFGPAQVLLKTRSTITAVLSLLDEKPFGYLQKNGKPVTLADGEAEASGRLDFQLKPKQKPEDVNYDVTAKLRNVRSSALAPGRVITAAELDVSATNEALIINGDGRIGTVPVGFAWQTSLAEVEAGKSHLTGWIELSDRFAEEFNIGLPPGSLSGNGRGQIEIGFSRATPPTFNLQSDLAGVGLNIRAIGWSMAENVRGDLEVGGTLGEPPTVDKIKFNGGGLQAEGDLKLREDGSLDLARFSSVKIGTWLNAPVTLTGRGGTLGPAVQVTGGMIDLRQTSLSGDGGGSSGAGNKDGGPITLTLDRLQISDSLSLTQFRANLETAGGVSGAFHGQVNGGTMVSGRVVPQGNRSAFRITSKNAGGVLRSAGLLKKARDGDMSLILTPAPETGSYNGQLEITGFRLKGAPAFAALLNAISVVGLLEQFNKEGIHFSKLNAEFLMTPKRVTLYKGSAVGASMGISMDGYYNFDNEYMNMRGVFSPLYLVNSIGGIFTRKGEGLIGVNYKIKGPASSPKVSVNPLSALTPGLLREIFRKPPPKVQDEAEQTHAEREATHSSIRELGETPQEPTEGREPVRNRDR